MSQIRTFQISAKKTFEILSQKRRFHILSHIRTFQISAKKRFRFCQKKDVSEFSSKKTFQIWLKKDVIKWIMSQFILYIYILYDLRFNLYVLKMRLPSMTTAVTVEPDL